MAHARPQMRDIVIETRRLVMRPLAPGDATALATIASDPRVGLMLGLVPCPCPVSHAEQWVTDAPAQIAAGTDYPLAVRDKATGTLIAGAGLDERVSLGASGYEYELGYWFDPAYWGQGLATECAIAMRDWGFAVLKAGRLRATCLMDNPGSARVLEKTGFHYVNTVLTHRPARGVDALVCRYRMDKPRWDRVQGSAV